MRKQKGFSLIELLIVVAIILIIAAIAIPNLLRARIAANESAAASSIRTINTAEVSYTSSYPVTGYAPLLVNLGPGGPAVACPNPPTLAASCLIDGTLANANVLAKGGYLLNYAVTGAAPVTGYQAASNPVTFNSTGVKSFCSFEDAVVRSVSPPTVAGIGAGACAGTIPRSSKDLKLAKRGRVQARSIGWRHPMLLAYLCISAGVAPGIHGMP